MHLPSSEGPLALVARASTIGALTDAKVKAANMCPR